MTNNLVTIPGYRIIEQIYNGSRTEVYRALAESDQKPVVIKLLLSEYPTFNELVQFRNQYTIAKNLDLVGIVKPITLLNYRNGFALVMEDIGSVSLAKEMEKTSYSLSDFFNIAIQIVQTLEGLTHNRIIHKDIKPQNILINPETREVKLIDFSISSLLPRENQEIQNPNVLEGTLAYMSPEQTGRMNRGIDYRTDFYSLGVTLYELLTGQLPFVSNDPMELVHCHIAKIPTPLIELIPTIPQVVSDIVIKLMAKNAEERYQSAPGLRYDLENCWQQWQEKSSISQFPLGERDKSDRFVIPEKLYGRETEVSTLLSAFERVSDGNTEIMLVAGFSGIGKTAVVNEVHKPIVRQRGYFIKGKFDQFKRDIPFSAWVQAFQNLMRQLLTESQTEVQEWKAKILSALGDSAGVIIDVIPELELLIGKQPEVPELEGSAAQNRFNLLLQKFIQVLATQEHTLVIFLDDLQWADSASLKLMQLLMSETDTRYLLLMGAYRDNEVFAAHPLILTLEEIRKAEATVNQITLAPLDQPSLNCLIADTLNCSPERAVPLTELVFTKTKGNPFFATQFLKSLHQDGLISFDFTPPWEGGARGGWQCDIAKVRALALTDDVVEFMAFQLQKLPINTLEVLKLAACIGNQFDLATLAIVHEKSPAETAADLWRALQEGLVTPITEIYKLFQENSQENEQLTTNNRQLTVPYKFLHDRVQQAAYSLIPEDQKKATHLKIGQLLLRNTPTAEREEKIFDIVNQLNIGVELITSQIERDELAKLNLIAGRKAKVSTAYAAAKRYLAMGLELLTASSWLHQYDLTLALHENGTEVAYLSGDFEQMKQLAAIVLQQAKTILDKVKVYEVKISACIAETKQLEAIEIGLQVLPLLGVNLPTSPTPEAIQQTVKTTANALVGKSNEELLNLPLMTDEYKLAALGIIASMTPAAAMAAPILTPHMGCEEVNLLLQYGHSVFSPYAFADYAIILNLVVRDFEASYRYGCFAVDLIAHLNAKKIKSAVLFKVAAFSVHGQQHIGLTQPLLTAGYQSGLENGDLAHSSYCAVEKCQYAYFAGQELTGLEKQITNYSYVVAKNRQITPLTWLKILWQSVLNLLGKSENPLLLIGEAYDNTKMLSILEIAKDRVALELLYLHQASLCYLFDSSELALEYAAKAEEFLDGCVGLMHEAMFYYYDSLVQLSAANFVSEVGLVKVENNQAKMQKWAASAAMNFQHKYDLVEAERYRVLGQNMEAMEMYDRAIQGAKENEYINEEALANERAAKFYLSWSKEKIAQVYLTEAYYAYARWGAKAKVEDLEKRYPQLLSPILNQKKSPETGETFVQMTTGTITSTSSGVSDFLDLTTVIKASQALSGEINLDKLLSTVMQVAIENAGASKGVLILERGGNLLIEAVGKSDTSKITVLQSVPIETSDDVPKSLINYVARTQEPLIYNNLPKESQTLNDTYIIQHQPKSVLCLPIQNQGKAIAILYLENNLTVGAFTPDRLTVLKILTSQAAISIENAQLYANLETKVEERTQELQQSEARFRQLYEQSADAILLLDGEAFIDCNSAAVKMMRCANKKQLLSLHPSQLSPEIQPDGRSSFEKANEIMVMAFERGSYRFEWMHRRLDGEDFWVEVLLTVIPLNDKKILHTVWREIGDRKQAEAALYQKNQELSDTLQQLKATQDELIHSEKMAALGQLVAGVAHEINTPLGAIRSSIGYVSDFLAQNLNRLPLFFQKLSPERQQQFLEMLERSQQNSLTVSGRERRQLRKAIASQLQAQGIAEADTFANLLLDLGISDSLEPYISLFQDPECEEFLKTLRQFVRLQESTRDINTASERAAKIVFALKTYARFDQSGETIEANIVEGIEAVLTLYQNQLKQGVKVIRNYQELPSVPCYFDELNQVWTNLIHNSLQAMDNRGTLTVETKQENGCLSVSITDSGQGIPEEIQEKIFQPFFTTKPPGEGSGLGLDIVKKIVEKHRGVIEFASVPGQTTFTVVFPIDKQ
ncbi:MAG: AAA family ATPase [Potamolinea sp.]